MKKRIFLTALALILVCALSIMGTVAFLKDQTKTVTNTFVAAGGGKLIDEDEGGALTLEEHMATKIMDENDKWTGKYEIKPDATTTKAFSYDIMPGTVVHKDPYVTITKKTATPAYLYIEVINDLSFSTKVANDEGELEETLVIDPANWLQIKDKATDGRDIYVYTTDGENPAIVTSDLNAINIIQNKKFTVNKDTDPATIAENGETLKFQAFLAQASVGEETGAEAVFDACFSTVAAPTPDPDPAP